LPRYVMDALQPLLNDKTADDLVFTALRGARARCWRTISKPYLPARGTPRRPLMP
jgi:hypothetical protein